MKDWLRLIIASRKRLRSSQDYQVMQSLLAELSVAQLQKKGINIANLHVLELGCGRGGYSTVLYRKAAHFVASDIYRDDIFVTQRIPFVYLDVTKEFPFKDESFDFIYCSSLIEHIKTPQLLLQEAHRVLRKEGILYLSFPPFYSLFLIGGHQFKPFHLLGTSLSIRLYNALHTEKIHSYEDCFGSHGLYPLTIASVSRMIATHFDLLETFTRLSLVNTARLPGILKDLLTWHVCFLARK